MSPTSPADGGPYFEEADVGTSFRSLGLTLTEAHAAIHQAAVGDCLALSLDADLALQVTGTDGAIVHPALVWDVLLGQSSLATQRGRANVFYRSVRLLRPVRVGDTVTTTTEVVARKQNRSQPTGLVLIRMTATVDGTPVADGYRCGLLPLHDPEATTGAADDLDASVPLLTEEHVGTSIVGWDLDAFADRIQGPRWSQLEIGRTWAVADGEVVTSAPELARLTLNLAAAHHDRTATGRGDRLVYGGHTVGIAFGQVCRAIPTIAAVTGWYECRNTGPVSEGDTLFTSVTVESARELSNGHGLVDLSAEVRSVGTDASAAPRPVLEWRFAAVLP